MWYKIKRIYIMNPDTRSLFVEAYMTLAVTRMAMALVSFKRLTRRLTCTAHAVKPPAVPEDQLYRAKLIGTVIELAAKNTLWDSACLARALTARRMLQRRGIPGVFYLGAAKEEATAGGVKAHAWSRCGDAIITGSEGHEAFTVMSAFSWEAP